jgi:hypothetical protein
LGGEPTLTARRRSKPKKQPQNPKSATDIPDDHSRLRTLEDLEDRLQTLGDMAKSMARQRVDAAMGDRSRAKTLSRMLKIGAERRQNA